MSYTPTILFLRDDLTTERIKNAQDHREDDHASRDFADEILMFINEPEWVRTWKGRSFVYLSPEFSSHTTHYKDVLDGWGVEYFEVGG